MRSASEEERLRAFIAVSPSSEVQSRLVRLKTELARVGAAVRWVRDDGLHNTLKFLGSLDAALLVAIRAALTGAAADFQPFTITVAGLGVFPNLERPRVVWVGLHGTELAGLALAVERALEPLGFAPEARPHRAHITGARGWKPLQGLLLAHWSDDLGSCTIDEVVAYRSNLQRGGSVYTRLWSIPLLFRREGGRGT
jgi:RNA 2',3'-cyclic 3'-phosphodiesterase